MGKVEKIHQERLKKFEELIEPHLNMVYKLCIKYSFKPEYVEDNYVECLGNMFKYIDTYDSSKSIRTWIHIVTKRYVFNVDKNKHLLNHSDLECDEVALMAYDEPNPLSRMTLDNYKEFMTDEILEGLDLLTPAQREAFLLQVIGYKLKEIVEIAFENKTIKVKNIETIKSRIFLARETLKKYLNRDGTRRAS